MATTQGPGDRWTEVDRDVELLSHVNRRRVLRYLSEGSADTATVDELAAHVRTRTANPEDGPRSTDGVEIELYHLHLPKMDDAGIVEFDPDAGTAELVAPATRSLDLLEKVSGTE